MKGTRVSIRFEHRQETGSHSTPTRARAIAAASAVLAAAALLAALMLPARAAIFPDLYTLTVPNPQADGTGGTATSVAMRRLLTRVTGERDPAADPDLARLISSADDFVSYSGNVERNRVLIEFYANRIEQALAAIGRPAWGPERPLTLLWIAVDGGDGERVLLSADGVGVGGLADTIDLIGVSSEMSALADEIRTAIETAADERALPIAFPLLDLADLTSVMPADIWGGFDDEVAAGSERYGADAILIGRIRTNPFGNSIQWTLVRGQERSTFASTEVEEGLHWVADLYAQAFSVVGGARVLRLVVRDVGSLDDLGRVMSYLESLSTLQSVEWEGYESGSGVLSLRAYARGDVGVLERMLGLGRVLQIDQPVQGAGDTLVMRLVRGSRQ